MQGGNVTGEEAIAVMQIRGFEGADHPLTLPKLAHSSAQPLLVGFGFKRFPEASTTGSRSGWLGQPAGDP